MAESFKERCVKFGSFICYTLLFDYGVCRVFQYFVLFLLFFFKFHLRTQLQSTNVTRQQYRIFELKWSSKDRG